MSVHIDAHTGYSAETILLQGKPLREKWMVDFYFTAPICLNEVRGMNSYSGYFNGKHISVMSTGMVLPNISVYANELTSEFKVKYLISAGSADSYQPNVHIKDIVNPFSDSSNSGVNRIRFGGADYSPTVNYELFSRAREIAKEKSTPVKAGNIFSSNEFYENQPEGIKKCAEYGVLCVQMETTGLYTIAAKHKAKALALLNISDCLIIKEKLNSKERERSFDKMIEIPSEIT